VLSNESEKLILEAWRREADRAQKRLERFEDQLAGVVTLSLGTAVIGIGAVGYVGQHKGSPLDFMPIAGILLLGIGGVISIGARLRVQSSTKSLRQTAASTVPAPSSGVDGLTTLQKLAKLEQERTAETDERCSTARRLLIRALIVYLLGVLLIAVAVYLAVPSDPRDPPGEEQASSHSHVPPVEPRQA